MHERQSQQHAYYSLLARLPKFSKGMFPTSFLQSLENQLRDGGVQENRWLTALESCLDGPAQESFFRVVKKCDRADYASAKMQLIRVAGPTLANKLEQVTVFRWPKDGSKTTLWGDCIEHVASFLVGGESGEEVAFKWALSRTLAHCKQDCAEAVWKASPKSAPEAIEVMRLWEEKHGSAEKIWYKKPDGYTQKRVDSTPGFVVKKEPVLAAVETGIKVKVERDCSIQRSGQGERKSYMCYKCGEAGHLRRNCPKTVVKRVEVLSDEEDAILLMDGWINGKSVRCEIDTGAGTCMIPRRLEEGLPVTGKALCKAVSSSFMVDSVWIRVQVGCIDKEVSAAVTPDDFMVQPLIGRNVGIDELLECAVVTRA